MNPTGKSCRRPCAQRLAALVLLLACMFVAAASASDPWYVVEIIVFDDLEGEGLRAELWPPDPGEPSPEDAVLLASPAENAQGEGVRSFRLVNRSQLSLRDTWNALRRSDRYRPLLHAGWRLPGVGRDAARPAYLVPRTEGARDDPAVHGTVKVSLARFLQVELDLVYSRPVFDDDPALESTIPTRFRLVAERRVRSGELHYIDHPVFGVLVLITPV